jgi:hypothetical protein
VRAAACSDMDVAQGCAILQRYDSGLTFRVAETGETECLAAAINVHTINHGADDAGVRSDRT